MRAITIFLLFTVSNAAWSMHLSYQQLRQIPNVAPLDERLWKPDAPLVPKGTTNAAIGKPVSASAAPSIGNLKQVTDGVNQGSESEYVELPPGQQWFQIDLQEQHEIYAVVPWQFRMVHRVYKDVVIQVSDDAEFKHGVKTIYNTDFDDSAGFGVGNDTAYVTAYHEPPLVAVKPPVTCRYVRFYSNGNNRQPENHMVELEVYGRKISDGAPPKEDMQPLTIKMPKPLFVE